MQAEDLHDRSLPPRNFDWQFFHSLKKSKNECGIFVSLKAWLRTIYLPFRYPLFCEVVRPQLESGYIRCTTQARRHGGHSEAVAAKSLLVLPPERELCPQARIVPQRT